MTRLNPALRGLFRAPVYLYRWNCGRLLGRRFLLLVHTGRRTGQQRYTVLEIMEYRNEGPEAVVMSAFGCNADWLRNIEATPGPEVVIGTQRFVAAHGFLDEDEALRVIAGYEQRHWLIAPIIRSVLSRLLGWRYHSSTSDRRRLVKQLPLVSFRPASRPRPRGRCGRYARYGHFPGALQSTLVIRLLLPSRCTIRNHCRLLVRQLPIQPGSVARGFV